MINNNKQIIILLVLLLPLLSGCSLLSENKKLNSEKNDQKEVVTDDIIVPDTTTPVESVGQTKNYADNKINTDSTSVKKVINNLNKNNPMDQFDANKQYGAVVQTTLGNFTIKFSKGQTSKTVENFITLAKKGFYDKTIFHRVIKGFMVQGGDPVGNGTGGPGYKFADEPFTGEYVRGAVAMANSGPNTNGSQFFIMHADYPLPKNYTIFGQVITGMETVDKIAESKVAAGVFGENSTPVEPTVIKSIEITEK